MSTIAKLPKDQILALRVDDVLQYVRAKGWVADSGATTDRVVVLHAAQFPDVDIVVPRSRSFRDYESCVAETLQTVALVEERSVWQVLKDISTPSADVMRMRLISPNATLGTVPLDQGLKLIQGGRDLLLAAACSAHQPQAHYPRQSYREALDFMETCRLGQTERGSFVASIVAPVPPLVTQSEQKQLFEQIPPSEPYARRVTMTLMSGLHSFKESVDRGDARQTFDSVDRGVSANLCEALAFMKPSEEQAVLEIQLSWAPTRPQSFLQISPAVSFTEPQFAFISEVGRELRKRAVPKAKSVEGNVVRLSADSTLFEGFRGQVILQFEIDGQSERVRMTLGRDEYKKACDAHRDGHRVRVAGELARDGAQKVFELKQPTALEVLRT